jgi:hypothetical protein
MKITPIAYTSLGWLEFDAFTTKATGHSPIRYLDDNKISPGSIYAYIVSLELLLGNRIKRISQAQLSLNHINLSFAVECDAVDILMFNDIHAYKITKIKKVERSDIYHLLITMTLQEWKDTIVRNSTLKGDKYLREVMNDFYYLFHKANLGELFEGHDQNELPDGTFILE